MPYQSLGQIMKWTAVSFLLGAGTTVAGVEPLDAPVFLEACRNYDNGSAAPEERAICVGYIQGYFSARDDVIRVEELPTSYMRRVIRTRFADNNPEIERVLNGRYCLPDGYALDDMISVVAQQEPGDDIKQAGDVMEKVLEDHFVCEGRRL
ncbi:MAG: Rap1a/Tai family immunity protein [Pseudohongiellaceae bacterium]